MFKVNLLIFESYFSYSWSLHNKQEKIINYNKERFILKERKIFILCVSKTRKKSV